MLALSRGQLLRHHGPLDRVRILRRGHVLGRVRHGVHKLRSRSFRGLGRHSYELYLVSRGQLLLLGRPHGRDPVRRGHLLGRVYDGVQ